MMSKTSGKKQAGERDGASSVAAAAGSPSPVIPGSDPGSHRTESGNPTAHGRTPHDELESLREELAQWKDTAQRAQAEFENTKKRLIGQQQAALERVSEQVVAGLIPVMDDLEYGITHARETCNDMADGLEAIYTKLTAVLAAEGVHMLDPTGQVFDHNTAQAVQMVEDASQPDQTVTQVLQKGYVMGGGGSGGGTGGSGGAYQRVIRPAMVVVTTRPSGERE